MSLENCHNWICPDLRDHWELVRVTNAEQYLLRSLDRRQRWVFSLHEGYALRFFTGRYIVAQVQSFTEKYFSFIESNLIAELIAKLIEKNILSVSKTESESDLPASPQLKACVQWFRHPDGYWILRNPEDVKRQMQVSDRHKAAIDQLGQIAPTDMALQNQISPAEIRSLLNQLAVAGMLVGIEPPLPPKRKFTPLQLLFFSKPLCNPDRWLSQYVGCLRWIWTPQSAIVLICFLSVSLAYGLRQQADLMETAIALWQHRNFWLILSFGLLSLLVISLHELGHAFTLKHFDRIVPEVGLMFMFFFPAAYTNTTDQYALTRMQRSLVVGAGVICQLAIAAFAFWFWMLTDSNTWLNIASYLLMVAALLTVTLNLNPLTKFDGYYLTLALTGINNLRSRSFALYANLLKRQPIREKNRDRWILAFYAPFSLAYSLTVLSFLLIQVTGWSFTNVPTLIFLLLIGWLIYFYFPSSKNA